MDLKRNTTSDQTLLSLLKTQKEEALYLLYEKYWDDLYLQAFKVLKDTKSCEDIVQEVFIDVWKKSDQLTIQHLKAYLYQATRFKVLMVLRKGKISSEHLEVFQRIQARTDVNTVLEVQELKEQILVHLNHLPQKCREVFYKSRFEHITNQEIADQMGISKRTVETHISHAIKYLRGVKEILMLVLGFFI